MTTVNDLMALNKKSLCVVVVFAELLRHLIEVQNNDLVANRQEFIESDDPDYHITVSYTHLTLPTIHSV